MKSSVDNILRTATCCSHFLKDDGIGHRFINHEVGNPHLFRFEINSYVSYERIKNDLIFLLSFITEEHKLIITSIEFKYMQSKYNFLLNNKMMRKRVRRSEIEKSDRIINGSSSDAYVQRYRYSSLEMINQMEKTLSNEYISQIVIKFEYTIPDQIQIWMDDFLSHDFHKESSHKGWFRRLFNSIFKR